MGRAPRLRDDARGRAARARVAALGGSVPADGSRATARRRQARRAGRRAGTSDHVLFTFTPPETVAIVNPSLTPIVPTRRPHLTTSAALPKKSMEKARAVAAAMARSKWNPFVKEGREIFAPRGSNNW